jgi:hypothetical protein
MTKGLQAMTMRRTMLLAIAIGLAGPTLATAQDVVADVETFRGVTMQISQPYLETLYTVIPTPVVTASGTAASGTPGGAAQAPVTTMGRTIKETQIGAGPQPIQARRSQNSVTFVRNGVEMQVPFDRLVAMLVERRPVTMNRMPAYVDPVMQSTATVTLVDGATIEGASVNFGSAMLRGMSSQGAIELPLEDVKTIRIKR